MFLMVLSIMGLQVYIDFLQGKTLLVSDSSEFYIPLFGFLGCFGIFVSVFRLNFRKMKYIKTIFLFLGIFVSLEIINHGNFATQSIRSFDDLKGEAFYLWLFWGPCVVAFKYIYLQLFNPRLEVIS